MAARKLAQRSPSYRFSFSTGAIVFFTFPWINSLLNRWGYKPYQGAGILIGLALALAIAGLVVGMDFLLFRLGILRPVRSGLWLAATLGPLAGFAVFNTWGNGIAAQASAVLATLVGFVMGYSIPNPDKN